MAELTDALGRVPLFAKLPEKERRRLAERMAERAWSAGQRIAEQGRTGIGFWVIEEGRATVQVDGEDVRGLGPGDHFGELALIDEGPRSATVLAETDLRCRGMTAWEFRPFVERNPQVAWTLLQELAARLRAAERRRSAAGSG